MFGLPHQNGVITPEILSGVKSPLDETVKTHDSRGVEACLPVIKVLFRDRVSQFPPVEVLRAGSMNSRELGQKTLAGDLSIRPTRIG